MIVKKGKRCGWGRQIYSNNLKATYTMTKYFGNTNGKQRLILMGEIGETIMEEFSY